MEGPPANVDHGQRSAALLQSESVAPPSNIEDPTIVRQRCRCTITRRGVVMVACVILVLLSFSLLCALSIKSEGASDPSTSVFSVLACMILGSVRDYSVADLTLFFFCLFSAFAFVPLVVLRVAHCVAALGEAREARINQERGERHRRQQLRRCEDFVVSEIDLDGDGDTSSRTGDGNCAICLESFQVGEHCRRLPCDHVFHADCSDGWLREHHSCPNCRYDVRAPEDIQEADAAVAQAGRRRQCRTLVVLLAVLGLLLWFRFTVLRSYVRLP